MLDKAGSEEGSAELPCSLPPSQYTDVDTDLEALTSQQLITQSPGPCSWGSQGEGRDQELPRLCLVFLVPNP